MFKEMMDLFEESIVITDKELHILYLNQAFEELFNVRFADVNGRHIDEVFPETPEQDRVAGIALRMKTNLSFRHIRFNWGGEDKILRVQTRVTTDENDDVKYIMTQIEDITEKALLEEEREKTLKKMTVNIIPLTNEVGVLPLQSIHSDLQKQVIIDNTLEQCRQADLKKLAVDLSSLHKVDDELASILSRMFGALGLIGIEVFVSGIQAKVVPLVQSHFSELLNYKTYQTLHQAIQDVLEIDENNELTLQHRM